MDQGLMRAAFAGVCSIHSAAGNLHETAIGIPSERFVAGMGRAVPIFESSSMASYYSVSMPIQLFV